MRGAAESLATPPGAYTMNMIKVIEVKDVSIPLINSRHQGDF